MNYKRVTLNHLRLAHSLLHIFLFGAAIRRTELGGVTALICVRNGSR